ncbi:hypothetical protein B0H14DRAFT_2564310 [Mycena olivaceomarginata]|nr:hypothetical protein B0H14DRAFT_2564310 [Mycena olivaceomarginata]
MGLAAFEVSTAARAVATALALVSFSSASLRSLAAKSKLRSVSSLAKALRKRRMHASQMCTSPSPFREGYSQAIGALGGVDSQLAVLSLMPPVVGVTEDEDIFTIDATSTSRKEGEIEVRKNNEDQEKNKAVRSDARADWDDPPWHESAAQHEVEIFPSTARTRTPNAVCDSLSERLIARKGARPPIGKEESVSSGLGQGEWAQRRKDTHTHGSNTTEVLYALVDVLPTSVGSDWARGLALVQGCTAREALPPRMTSMEQAPRKWISSTKICAPGLRATVGNVGACRVLWVEGTVSGNAKS